ncbi:hypothetical protein D0867_12393 [Hortaea werneckii]|uniref:RNA polymerase II subunit A C-terminal domain phosphatase n=1 Tax=Hortaea werneckii TaxID=91943 RepID=A0A3M6ZTY6_HORWE|nr:hypothetical protein D0867_12393 [Hortaea werneckii]RMY18784.1 hypothetical protein D0866_13070 [Hortaea werneckii]
MRIHTRHDLAYPITVTRLLRAVGDEVEENGVLFGYKYRAKVTVWDADLREDVQKDMDHFGDFSCEAEGTITTINVSEGQVLRGRTFVAEVEEPCKHEVQFGGMCANCGKDMNMVTYNKTVKDTSRATINTVHGHTALLVSQEEAGRADDEAKRRLLDTKKLSLVVDLDQTIIHATVDPTVGEWQQDEENPNHAAVKDVRKFQLVDEGPGGRGTWYYIKLRPGLKEFLQTISQYYELHIYTMATRAYAKEISNIVDPDHKLFADRILSRDENGSMNSKNLKRLFPVDTKMVVIIDDRGDVWSWSPNLVKVPAYDFFVGIGDINSSFLPKRPELEARPKQPKADKGDDKKDGSPSEPASSSPKTDASSVAAPSPASTAPSSPPAANGEVSAVDRIVSMAGKEGDGSMEEKTQEQDKIVAEQMADRPLLQKQKILDAAEKETESSPAAEAATEMLSEDGVKKDETPNEHSKYRHNLLQDDDNELESLANGLRNIHKQYFEQYERDNVGLMSSRVNELKEGGNSAGKKRSIDELERIPDAAIIISALKNQVLKGVNIVFSGVVPLGVNIHNCDIGIWAKSFGARISENITKRTTHVVASPERRTAKVRSAAKKGGRIQIVNQNWLYACFSAWRRMDEEPYRIHTDAGVNGKAGDLPDEFKDGNDQVLSSSDEEAAVTESETDDTGTGTDTEKPNGHRGLEIDTELDDLQQYAPSSARKDSSPTATEQEENWGDIDDELKEFLGSDAEDISDTESVRTDSSASEGTRTPSSSQKKRKRDPSTARSENGADGVAGESESEVEGSRLQKRKKEALGRTTSLTKVQSAAGSNTANPAVAVEEGGDSGGEEDDGAWGGEDDLEAALAAEMSKPDEGEGGAAA